MHKVILSGLCLTTLVAHLACQKSSTTKFQTHQINESESEGLFFNDRRNKKLPAITVTNLNGEPIAQAKVLFGNKPGNPFVDNVLETNKTGQVTAPSQWNGPLSVSVYYPGFMKVTYFNVNPQNLTFKIRPIAKTSQIQLSGKTTQFGNIKQDNIADFGLVIQSLNRGDLFSFNIDKLISPESDNLKVGGIFDSTVPSNLTFPRQHENYVVPISLEKERYRLYFRETGVKRSYALHGQFPFKETIDKFRNKVPFTTLINSFRFVSGGLKEFQLDGPLELDLPVNEMTFNSQEQIIPPELPDNFFMLSISLFEQNGMLYPTDMHSVVNPQPFTLKSIDKAKKHFISVLAINPDATKVDAQHQEASSIEFISQSPNHTPHFIDIIPSPTPVGLNGWTGQSPRTIDGILPLTTFSVFSSIVPNGKSKKIQREWEVYAENWVTSIELPEWPEAIENPMFEQTLEATHRWEVVYIGTNQKLPISIGSILGPDSSEITSHVSFNSVEF